MSNYTHIVSSPIGYLEAECEAMVRGLLLQMSMNYPLEDKRITRKRKKMGMNGESKIGVIGIRITRGKIFKWYNRGQVLNKIVEMKSY